MAIGKYVGMLMLAGLPLAGCRADKTDVKPAAQQRRLIPLTYVQRGILSDFYVKNGLPVVEDIGANGTPDVYFEAGKEPVYLRRKGLLEIGQGYHSDDVVDVETAEGQKIEKKCYGFMKEVEEKEHERKKLKGGSKYVF